MNVNLEHLNKDYLQGKVVPFIGAGLSAPFKVPTWRALIEEITNKYATGENEFVKKAVKVHLDRNDYWKAVDQLKDFLNLVDQDIQSEIAKIIDDKIIKVVEDEKHNYLDLAHLNFNIYLTTNYENLLNKYVKCDVPLILKDINFNTQDLFDKKRVIHLHGYTSNSGSIVISRESYQELYNNDKLSAAIFNGSGFLCFRKILCRY